MLPQRCRFLTPGSSLPPLGSCRLDPRRCSHHPSTPASPTPRSRQLEVRRVTQVAGLSFGDLGPARLLGGPKPLTRVSQPSSNAGRSPKTLTRFPATLLARPDRVVPVPGGGVALFGLGAHSSRSAGRTGPPRCRPPFLSPRRARSPRIPLSKLFRASSVARCPLPALELAAPSIALRLLQPPGLPPRTAGHREAENSGTKESAAHHHHQQHHRDSPACPGSRAPAPIRDAPLTAALQPAGASGVPRDLARPGSMHCLPGSPAALARALARAASLSGLGSGQPDSPLRSPPAPSALCCA